MRDVHGGSAMESQVTESREHSLRRAIADIRADHPEIDGLVAMVREGTIEIFECNPEGYPTGKVLRTIS